jgi:hypothetical protein
VARTRKTSDDGSNTPSGTDSADRIDDAEIVNDTSGRSAPDDAPLEETTPQPEDEVSTSRDGDLEHNAEVGTPVEDTASAADDAVRRDDPPPEAEPAEAETTVAEPPRQEAPAEAREEPPPPPPAAQRGSGGLLLALVFGGLIAALAGVAAARFLFPDGWPGQGDTAAQIAALQSTLEDRDARLAELESALAGLGDRIGAIPDPAAAAEQVRAELGGQIAAAAASASEAAARMSAVEDGLADLGARVEELAMRPMPEGLDAASLDAELQEFRQELSAAVDEARGQIVGAQEEAAAIAARAAEEAAALEQAAAEEAEALRAEAESAAETAAREAAIAGIRAAVESGEPYSEELAALGDVPSALAGPADQGVPTLAALVDGFAPAARAALDASIRATMGEGAMDRLGAFLRVQTGARSLEAREGDDPDAVLSRAEAALRAGDLDAALAELATLPEAGQAAMAGWTDAARTRLEAAAAARALTPN